MTTHNDTKLKKLFNLLQPNNVITAAVLDNNGVSRHLRRYYQESGWIEPLGRGAYKKPGDLLEWQAGVNALQKPTKYQSSCRRFNRINLTWIQPLFQIK